MKCYICKIGDFNIIKYTPPINIVIRSKAKFKCDFCGHEEIIR
jgi:predicted RNA-binding Zn-ribbon protein involved in translation (DUF1610 family)